MHGGDWHATQDQGGNRDLSFRGKLITWEQIPGQLLPNNSQFCKRPWAKAFRVRVRDPMNLCGLGVLLPSDIFVQ
jgi:hypothetical protein